MVDTFDCIHLPQPANGAEVRGAGSTTCAHPRGLLSDSTAASWVNLLNVSTCIGLDASAALAATRSLQSGSGDRRERIKPRCAQISGPAGSHARSSATPVRHAHQPIFSVAEGTHFPACVEWLSAQPGISDLRIAWRPEDLWDDCEYVPPSATFDRFSPPEPRR